MSPVSMPTPEFPSGVGIDTRQIAGSECPRGTLLKTHSMNVLVDVGGVLSGHYLVYDRTALLLTTLLCGSQYARPR